MEEIEKTQNKVHSEKNITLGTFFGGPLAAGILLSKNYKTFGKENSARNAIYFSIFFTILLLGTIFFLSDIVPDKLLNGLIPLLSSGIVYFIIEKYQKKDIEEYLSQGFTKASAWKAVGIGILSSIIYLIIIIPIMFLTNPNFDSKKYDEYFTNFINNEKSATYIYQALQQNRTKEDLLQIADKSMINWDENIGIVKSMDSIKNLPEILKYKDTLLVKYCNLRKEELDLIKHIIVEPTDKSDSLIIEKQNEIKSVIDILIPNK